MTFLFYDDPNVASNKKVFGKPDLIMKCRWRFYSIAEIRKRINWLFQHSFQL